MSKRRTTGPPRAVLPDTATPRGSLRPCRRSPDTPPEPAPRGSRRPAPGAGGSRGGHTPHRPAVRDAPRDLAAGPWQTARPAGDPPGVPRPTAASGARSVASGGHSPVAASSRRARAASTSPGAVRLRRPGSPPDSHPHSGPRSSRQRYATSPKFVQLSRLRNSWGLRLGAALNSPGEHPFALDCRRDAALENRRHAER